MDPKDQQNLSILNKSPVNWLMEILIKEGVYPKFEASDTRTVPTAEPEYEMKCIVENYKGRRFEAAESARNKKSAKHRVSISMLNHMGVTREKIAYFKLTGLLEPPPPPEVVQNNGPLAQASGISNSRSRSESEPMPGSSSRTQPQLQLQLEPTKGLPEGFNMATNYVGNLQEFCVKHNLNQPSYEYLGHSGPSHRPEFKMSCTIPLVGEDSFVIIDSDRSSKKNLKQILAGKMLEKLMNTPKLEATVKKGEDLLANELKTVIDRLEKMGSLHDGPRPPRPSECSLDKCLNTLTHSHHTLAKHLTGPVLASIQEKINTNSLLESESIVLLQRLCDEQLEANKIAGVLYINHGIGMTEKSAREAAAKEALEFLGEISNRN